MDMAYRRVCIGTFNTKGILVPEAKIDSHFKDKTKPGYASVFKYNEAHFKQFQESGSVANIEDVVTDTLVWDLDCKEDLNKAKEDVLTLFGRFKDADIPYNATQLYFSGQKGFTVVVKINKEITPEEARNVCINNFAKELKTADLSVYNASRILRVPMTKHQESGLYKIPLDPKALRSTPVETIKILAKDPTQLTANFDYEVAPYKEEWNVKLPAKPTQNRTSVDLTDKPNNWRACKWNIKQGNFGDGERHTALTILAATIRSMGYNKTDTYYMCKSAIKQQAEKTGSPEFGKDELWDNIIEQSIFTPNWKGGAYTCKTDPWLSNYCKSLGDKGCQDHEDETPCITFDSMTNNFDKYAKNFETNVIKTGIDQLDDNLMLVCSSLNGLLGQPGSGKTSTSIQILRDTSMRGVPSIFFSMDMGAPIVYGKLLQRETGKSLKELMKLVRDQDPNTLKMMNKIKEDYKNTSFCFQSGLTVPDMRTIIKNQHDVVGAPIKLVVIDYLECIGGPYSDATANTGLIANQLKDLANDLNVCILLLLQTQKHSTPQISDPLLSLKGVKGSSIIEQSCSTITSLWREGYSPDTVSDDSYMSFAVVKNRFGSLWKGDFSWSGRYGVITELSDEQESSLQDFRNRKAKALIEKNNTNGFGWT